MASMAYATIKGGVGKTTLAVHTAAALADRGRKVLFIDLDPQGHGSLVLGLDAGDRRCAADAFGPRPRHSFDEVLVRSPRRENLFIAPACARMAAIERELFHWGHRLQAIRRAYDSLAVKPDDVVIDCPPSIGPFTEAALTFVDLVVAPVPSGAFALQGLSEVEAAWREVHEGGGELVAVVNQWDKRTVATNDAMEDALRKLTVPVLRTRVPRSESINQAGLGYEVVFDTAPKAPGARELKALSEELVRRARNTSRVQTTWTVPAHPSFVRRSMGGPSSS
jgi:chromosome partitioning protein